MALDYASILQAGQNLVPDLQEQMMRKQEVQLRQAALQGQQQQRALQVQAAAEKQRREAEFRARLAGVVDSNDPRAIGKLMMEFPEFADSIKPGYEALSNEARTRNLTQLGSAYQLATSGDSKGAAAVLRKRYDADVAAGQADETTKELLDALESDDPVQQRRAASTLGMVIAAQDPAKFTDAFKALNPSEKIDPTQREYEWRVRQFGQAAADQWLAVQDTKLVTVQEGGSVYNAADLVGRSVPSSMKGGDPAVAGGGPATGLAIEQAALSAVPGLTVTSRKRSPAKNASVGGQPNSFHLTDQARDFVPPKGMSWARWQAV
jgi:Peptidase M15